MERVGSTTPLQQLWSKQLGEGDHQRGKDIRETGISSIFLKFWIVNIGPRSGMLINNRSEVCKAAFLLAQHLMVGPLSREAALGLYQLFLDLKQAFDSIDQDAIMIGSKFETCWIVTEREPSPNVVYSEALGGPERSLPHLCATRSFCHVR